MLTNASSAELARSSPPITKLQCRERSFLDKLATEKVSFGEHVKYNRVDFTPPLEPTKVVHSPPLPPNGIALNGMSTPVRPKATPKTRITKNGSISIKNEDIPILHGAAPATPSSFYADLPKPAMVKWRQPAQQYRPEEIPSYEKASDNFDWGAENAGTLASLNESIIFKVARGDVELEKKKKTSVFDTDDLLLQPSFEQLQAQLTVGNTATVSYANTNAGGTPTIGANNFSFSAFGSSTASPLAVNGRGRGLVSPAKWKTAAEPINDWTAAPPSPAANQPEKSNSDNNFLELHEHFCLLCITAEHSTINCPMPPPEKLGRIRELQLCKKCLDLSHTAQDCPHVDIICSECGLQHLNYLFHKPDNWMVQLADNMLPNVSALGAISPSH